MNYPDRDGPQVEARRLSEISDSKKYRSALCVELSENCDIIEALNELRSMPHPVRHLGRVPAPEATDVVDLDYATVVVVYSGSENLNIFADKPLVNRYEFLQGVRVTRQLSGSGVTFIVDPVRRSERQLRITMELADKVRLWRVRPL